MTLNRAFAFAVVSTLIGLGVSMPAWGAEPAQNQIVRDAEPTEPISGQFSQALKFSVMRSLDPLSTDACEAAVETVQPGAELLIEGDGARFNGLIFATGEGFNRLVFEDPSGRRTCLAGGGGSAPGAKTVGGFQTLLRRPYGIYRFWISASEPGPFEVRIEHAPTP